jgi:general secretion pathway protein G
MLTAQSSEKYMKKYNSVNSGLRAARYGSADRMVRSAGFTLIEMVMVIALIGIVMSVVGSYAVQRFNQGKYNAGKAAVHSMDMKVQAYMLDNGAPPTTLNDLVARPGNAKPGDINDPFNHPFQYKVPGDHGEYDIIFLGKDGQTGGDGMNKDYGNWE